MSPPEPGKPGEIAIRGDELAPVLDGERSVIRVYDQLASSPRSHAQLGEDFPATGTVRERMRPGSLAEAFDEREGIAKSRRSIPDLRIGHDSDECAAAQLGQAKRLHAGRQVSKPGDVTFVFGRLRPMGVNEYVDVR
jgi:hypothetical protein